jgi:hypothetical protein
MQLTTHPHRCEFTEATSGQIQPAWEISPTNFEIKKELEHFNPLHCIEFS